MIEKRFGYASFSAELCHFRVKKNSLLASKSLGFLHLHLAEPSIQEEKNWLKVSIDLAFSLSR